MTLVNTDIISVAPSGINAPNVSHILFVPQPENLGKPSGSLWYRPNDGQIERLVVQGTSGILEVRNAEGFASYRSTTVQDVSASAIIISGWTSTVQDDAFMNITGADTVIIHVGGLHRLSYAVTYDNGTSGPNDGSVNTQILINGTKLDGSEMSAYMPTGADGGFTTTSFHGMAVLSRGDQIQIQADQISSIAILDTVSSVLNIELIRPRGDLL